jgi:hypothetical protein
MTVHRRPHMHARTLRALPGLMSWCRQPSSTGRLCDSWRVCRGACGGRRRRRAHSQRSPTRQLLKGCTCNSQPADMLVPCSSQTSKRYRQNPRAALALSLLARVSATCNVTVILNRATLLAQLRVDAPEFTPPGASAGRSKGSRPAAEAPEGSADRAAKRLRTSDAVSPAPHCRFHPAC